MFAKVIVAAVAGLALFAQPSEAVSCLLKSVTVNGQSISTNYETVSYSLTMQTAEDNLTSGHADFFYELVPDTVVLPASTLITTSEIANLVVNNQVVSSTLVSGEHATLTNVDACTNVINLSTLGSRTLNNDGTAKTLDSCQYSYEFTIHNFNC